MLGPARARGPPIRGAPMNGYPLLDPPIGPLPLAGLPPHPTPRHHLGFRSRGLGLCAQHGVILLLADQQQAAALGRLRRRRIPIILLYLSCLSSYYTTVVAERLCAYYSMLTILYLCAACRRHAWCGGRELRITRECTWHGEVNRRMERIQPNHYFQQKKRNDAVRKPSC